MKIGDFIQSHMNKKGITQAELARRSGVPASTISSIIIRNNDRVAIEMMLKICEVLECDLEEYINSLKKDPAKSDEVTEEYLLASRSKDGKQGIKKLTKAEYDSAVAFIETLRRNTNEDL